LADAVEVIRSEVLAGVPHGFLGRRGGVSQGAAAGLNVGHGADDAVEAVAENRRRAVDAVLPGAALATVYQVHSPDVVQVIDPWPHAERPHADAMVTDRPGLLLGIVTADCAPVLLADREAGVIGAAHAGWKGAIGGVLQETVAAMEELGAQRARIQAGIGPAIAQKSYEVGPEFPQPFIDRDRANARFFTTSARCRHFMFDLVGFVEKELNALGLGSVALAGNDTCAESDNFFSYRRTTLAKEPDYGRQISVIGLV
jgi:YfiH family protein